MTNTRKAIMARAHEIARTLTGDYSARMSIALKQAWVESKGVKTGKTVERYLKENIGLKTWENYGKKRIYIKNVGTIGFEGEIGDKERLQRLTIYYDCQRGSFYSDATRRLQHRAVERFAEHVRRCAKNA